MHIANPQISLVFQSVNRKFANFSPRECKDETPLCRYEFFYGELLAAGSHGYLPAPLERNLADAWTKVTA